jgi:hypothetical protein
MTQGRAAVGATSAAFIVLLLVLAVAAGYLAVDTSRPPASESTTKAVSLQSSTASSASTPSANQSASQTVSVQSTNASSTTLSSSLSTGSGINESLRGLELSVSTNATIQEGQNLTISMSLLNSSPSPLIVSASDDWEVRGFPVALWSPCTGLEPLEFMIVKGNYTLDDLQAASANSSISQGGCMEGGSVYNLVFQGEGSTANATGTFCEANCFPDNNRFDLDANFTVSGYWAYPINGSEAADVFAPPTPECTASGIPDCTGFQYPEVGPYAQHGFIPGSYTLAAADEWGQTMILHFAVTAATTTVTSSSGPQPPIGCAFAKTVTLGGVAEDIYLSQAPLVGSIVCIYDHVQSLPQFPESPVTFTITNSTDFVFFRGTCVDIQGESASCSTSWDTSQSFNGVFPSGGTYRLLISVGGDLMDTGISFTLSS